VRRTGIDLDAVPFIQAGIGTLGLGIVRAGPHDRALCVIDDDLVWATAEPLEGAPVAGQQGLDSLIEYDLGILVT